MLGFGKMAPATASGRQASARSSAMAAGERKRFDGCALTSAAARAAALQLRAPRLRASGLPIRGGRGASRSALRAMAWSRVALAALTLALVGGCGGLDNGVGLTPPMGFNTWNYFGCDACAITELLAQHTSDDAFRAAAT